MMKEKKRDETQRGYALIRILGLPMLALLILASVAGANPYAYITDSEDDDVSVIDTATNTVIATVNVGDRPLGVAVTPDGSNVYVANYGSNTVSVIDTATNTVAATVDVGDRPLGVAVTPDGSNVYVANFDSNTVSVIDTATNTVAATVDVGQRPWGVAVTPDGSNVYVTNVGSCSVSVIDTSTDTVVATMEVGRSQPHGIAFTPDGSKAYMISSPGTEGSDAYVIDTATNTVTYLDLGGIGEGPFGVAVTPDGSKVYITAGYTDTESDTLYVIDTATNNLITTVDVGDGPRGVAVTPDGSKVYAVSYDNMVSVIDTATNTVTTTVNVGNRPFALGQFIGSIPAPFEIQITRITTSGSASNPHIYGDRIVWEDSRDGKNDIYVYDLSTKQEAQISTSGTAYYPVIYGNRIVWEDSRNGKCDVYMYNLSTKQEIQISTSGTAYASYPGPDIYNDKIVWQDFGGEYTDDVNLVMHDLSTKQETQITTSGIGGVSNLGFYGFAIHGGKIAMGKPGGDDHSNIFMYDLSTSQEIGVSSGGSAGYPDIYGDKIAWHDGRSGDDYNRITDIYTYDLSTQKETQISTSGGAYAPAIYGNRIVWEDYRSGQNIYMYDLSSSKETQITTSGSAKDPAIYENRIVWVDGNDIYMGTLSETIVSEIEVSDNRLREASPDTVYKSSSFIDVGSISGVGRYRDVIQFDLSEYTSDSHVGNATLSLYWYYPAGKTRPEDTIVEVYRPASSWNSDYVSWNKRDKGIAWKNPGGDWYDKNSVSQGSTPYATITIKGSSLPDNKYYKLDVTDLVKEYTSGKYENTGFLIKARTEINNYIAFYSSDWTNENQKPKITVTEKVPVVTVPVVTVNATVTGATDNRLREASPDTVYKSSPYIDVGGENSFRWRNVIRFNLSEYSSDTSIKNAALSLYWYYPAGKTRPENTIIEVYRPTSAWNSDYVSWNKRNKGIAWKNPGGDWYDKNGVLQGNIPYATLTLKGSDIPDNKYYKLDVTDLVKEYTSGKYENTGFLIKARTERNNYIAFYSSDCGNEKQVPKLQLVYS